MTCPNAPDIHAYHDGQLCPSQRAGVQAHLAACPDCATVLNDLRLLTQLIVSAPLPAVSSVGFDRFYNTWHLARQRSVLRISSWLTAAAAAVLIGALVLFPAPHMPVETVSASARPSWEPVALMAPILEDTGGRDDELVEVAQWMADDLGGESW